ncbi:MAG: hexose kinase [Erysipelotrichaceae bacterium]|nr:hexose kinase [Erysipelotrichaceae bacterium]
MICTCTMNPSLDYYMEFDKELNGNDAVNRSSLEYYEAGGKGINVSIVLNNLGIPTRAFGFVGGFTKDFYISLLAKYENIRPNFTYINGHTRINVKCSAEGQWTDLNASGPIITAEDMDNLKHKVSTLYSQDYFVLAGHTQEYLCSSAEEMLKNAIKDEVKVVLDTNAPLVRKILPCHPFMIKTTMEELPALIDREVKNEADAIAGAKELHEAGARYVIVSDHSRLAYLICKEGTYRVQLTRDEKYVSFVGTGDSLIAGFLMNYMRTKNPLDSFRFGVSCGSATAYSKGLATRANIDNFYETTKVEKIA